jgi:ParB family chromosome partitioning protein
MPSAKRDLSQALKGRVLLGERPQIAGISGERLMPGAKLVAVTRISSDPDQPRKHFDPEALEGLAVSIRERGILQPLRVRPLGDGYCIVMGERRYRAALIAGIDEVPVLVGDATPEEAFLDALTENVQRANLTDEEEAEAYRGLLAKGYSVRQIAARIGIAPSKVSRITRIYEDPVLAEAMIQGAITKSQAQELLVAPEEEKPRLVRFVAGRRKRAEPVSLGALRDEVARVRQGVASCDAVDAIAQKDGVALRNILDQDGEVVASAGSDGDGQDRGDVALRNASPTVTIDSEAYPSLEDAREQAHLLRHEVVNRLARLAPHAGDQQVAQDLGALRVAIERVLGRHRD